MLKLAYACSNLPSSVDKLSNLVRQSDCEQSCLRHAKNGEKPGKKYTSMEDQAILTATQRPAPVQFAPVSVLNVPQCCQGTVLTLRGWSTRVASLYPGSALDQLIWDEG